jgi:hypothetical protein
VLESALKSGISRVIHLNVCHPAKCADVTFNEESQISQLQVIEYRRSKLVVDRIVREF